MRPPFAALLVFVLLLVGCQPTAVHPDEPQLRALLERYFATWSAADMTAYGACFHPSARVVFVEKDGQSISQGLTDFLHGQKLGHERAASPMREIPTRITISGDSRVAQADVRWQLTKGSETITGTDYFTLIKTAQGWQIAALVFYND